MRVWYVVVAFVTAFPAVLFAQQDQLQIALTDKRTSSTLRHEATFYMGTSAGLPTNSPGTDRRWYFRGGVGWLELNGTKRLVRGNRKVVTTDADGGVSLNLEVEYKASARYGFTLGFTRLKTRYTHSEDFTNGRLITTTDDLSFSALLAGINYHFVPERRLNLYIGTHLAYITYSDELHLMSEQTLPDDLGTINPTPFNLTVHNGLGFGLVVGGDLPLSVDGWFISSNIGLTLAWMSADIIDDPEDPEDGSDIFSPMHPLRIRVARWAIVSKSVF